MNDLINFLSTNDTWFWLFLMIVFVVFADLTQELILLWAATAAIPLLFISQYPVSLKLQVFIFLTLTAIFFYHLKKGN